MPDCHHNDAFQTLAGQTEANLSHARHKHAVHYLHPTFVAPNPQSNQREVF